MTLIDFLIKSGAEKFIEECRDRLFKIRNLQEYNFYEGSVDKGSGVREKAKQIVELLASNELIRTEREKARVLRNKLTGIDSRNSISGGGYSGSYGGSGGGGYGGGGIGGDSYNSGGGRYSSDYNRRSSEYDGGSGDGNLGRYGGGAYDSRRPPRYGDDAPSEDSYGGQSRSNGGGRGFTDEPADDFDTRSSSLTKKSATSSPAPVNANSGKLKVTIKNKAAAPTPSAAPEVDLFGGAEVDLIGGDDPFSTSGAPSVPAASASFDPFGIAAAPVPAPAPAPATVAFDPFGPSPAPAPVAPTAAAFDPFASAPAPYAAPAATPVYGYASAPPVFPPQQQAQMQPQQQFQQFQQAPPIAQTMQQPAMMSSGYRPQPAPATTSDADFGDFTGPATTSSASSSSAAAAAAAVDKWGSLVDLSKIEKNEDLVSKQKAAAQQNERNQANYASNSFAGLDGFSKSQQSMVS